MKKLKTFESFFSNLFKNKKNELTPEIKSEIISPTAKLINYLEQDTIKNLHDFGYSDANNKNIYTNDIYAFHFKNRLEKNIGKNKNVDNLICDMISNITGYEDYILDKDVDKYNL